MFSFRKKTLAPATSSSAQSTEAETDTTGDYFYVKAKGERRWYRIAETGKLSLLKDAPVAYSRAFSLDEEEIRLPVPGAMSYHAAYRLLKQEKGVHSSLINRSKQYGTIYGIEEAVAHSFPSTTIPMLQLVDKLMRQKERPANLPSIALLVFGQQGELGLNALVIGFNVDNTVAISTLATNVADLNPVLSNAIRVLVNANTLRGLPFNPALVSSNAEQKALETQFINTSVVRIEYENLQAAASGESGYPREAMIRGVALRRISKATIGIAAAAAMLGWSAVLVLSQQIKSVQAETEVINKAREIKQGKVRLDLLTRIEGLATKLTIEPEPLFDAAQEIWKDGTRVQLDATLFNARLNLVVPNLRASAAPGLDKRLANIAPGETALVESLRTPAPKGWTFNGIETSGDLNAFNVAFTTVPVDVGLLDIVGLVNSPGQAVLASTPAAPAATSNGKSLGSRK